MAIRYTPGQFRDALGLTKETFRYWKRDLPALAAVAGHSPCFGPGELLATAVAKSLVDGAGVQISKLASLATELFSLLRNEPWPELERFNLLLFCGSGRAELTSVDGPIRCAETAILVPLRPLIERLRERLLAADVTAQRNLA